MAIKIIELYPVTPSQGGATIAAEQSLPLLYFDMIWLQCRPAETIFFYDLKCSESYFLETIVVELKLSLSTTLKHFLPLAGKIIFPLSSAAMPVSRYVAGDSVALTVALSDGDFANLIGNHPKDSDEFHQFVPQMPSAVYSDSDDHNSDKIKFSVVAIQVTLFPNQGICIGFTQHHAIYDMKSYFTFVNTWATIHKQNSDENFVGKSLPSYDRSRVQETNKLTAICWKQMATSRPMVSLNPIFPLNKIRATFILTNAEIVKLKSFASIARASTFVVVCAHLWSCLAKSAAAAGEEEVADDEPEYLSSPIDCRARLDPPLPETYFGNCLLFLQASSTHGRLKGNEGFVAGVEAVAAAIREATVGEGGGILDGFDKLWERDLDLTGKRVVRVAGSSRFNPYGVDYGWGRAIKYEGIHNDFDGAVYFCEARDGGVEIGMSMPKPKMDALLQLSSKENYTSIATCNVICSCASSEYLK